MAPEAPADTAGPSSPPPQLPEGWLPQWEGVGRKWYYVQRTTGKSQWEIPTEPIVLTPSTTPTPMGAGLPQEPKLHPTSGSTREGESVDTMAGGTYSAADSARISVGNRAHYVCSNNPAYGSSVAPGWYSNQTGQHLPGGYEQQLAANAAGYGPNPLHQGPVGQMNGVQPAYYGSQTHQGYQITGPHHMGQSISSSAWGNNPSTYQGHPSGYNMTQHAQSFQAFSADPAGLHGHQPPASWTITSNPQGQMARSMDGTSDPQPQWQLESQQGHLNASGEGVPMNLHPSTMPKPLFGSYSSNQNVEPSSGEFARRASNISIVREGQPYQTSADSFPNHSTHSMGDQGRFGQGQLDPRSHSQHALTDPALQGFSPLQHVQSQYQQQHMIRKQSGSHQVNLAQGHQQYHNPMAPVSFNQYGSQHQFGHSGGPTGFPETAHVHQVPYHQSSHYPEHIKHSPGETGRDPESHFVSGPWTSTPPSAGQL
ncbi:WW/Rsp5/WWP [Penicillium expansum]|uniref:WW/Rsp5/WWP n=1 Tax=Penicillium expansum TaxID=27334 RepID=A0A0A2IWG6_PENEN|nr:WW/Rsp5/WWP [Penicillium expansum]KGO46808.1 WW/Rsp5/WWP [Penicillium expansum]KGO54497.1 WW/Rsp5/WWP [Penicillium expansum]KGO62424.1 WW/Rsp5/WWP [Penicillium expansum]